MNILVTGASSGIGRALAVHYAEQGHAVGIVARRAELLDEMVAQHPTMMALPGDVTDGAAMETLIHRFAVETGELNLVYANAGIGQRSTEEGWDPERSRLIAKVNILGVTNTIAPAVTLMVEQGSGHVVGISSLAGQTPMPAAAAYGASKAWLVFYLESLAMDLNEHGIKCSSVMPGYVKTPMVDGPEAGLLTPQAQRAAALIAQRVARGDRIIRFPRRVAIMARLAAWVPARQRADFQRKRLAKRKSRRSE